MNRILSILVAGYCGIGCILERSAHAAQAKDVAPPVYTAPTPAVAPASPQPVSAPTAVAPAPPPAAAAQRPATDLEKLAMPIALHPDPLIAIILPASAYPVEIVQAARFVKDTNNIAKVNQQPWDENVKAVAKFPDLIAKMDADLAWTAALGQAFLDQPKELMDTIQALRAKAHKAGTLQSTPQQVVTVTNLVVMQNPDRVQATNEFKAFAAAMDESRQLVRESDTRYVLELGADRWPFPIPLVQRDRRWLFDTATGKEELLNRRIGQNELAGLKAVRAYVNAQREHASRDRDGDEVLEFAQKIASSPGRTDGLYWPPQINGEISPLGPGVARAQREGYFAALDGPKTGSQPFHGDLFKILTRQGSHAPGGKYGYIINANMIGGFALVAWPAEYGVSGVMTFLVNQQGKVYQRDLGKDTARIVRKITTYDPDSGWRISAD